MFIPYCQDMAKEANWINYQVYYEDEIELNELINDDADS